MLTVGVDGGAMVEVVVSVRVVVGDVVAVCVGIVVEVARVVGVAVGAWLRTRIQPATFRTIFFAGLLVLGAELVFRSLP